MQEHLMTNPADQRVPGRPGTTPWITEFLVFLFLQLNSKIKIAKTMSKKLIEKFENQDSFLQDLKQTKEINKFSEKSQELIADMNNTEKFELFETFSKQSFPDCNSYWEAGIVYCICGRGFRVSQSTKEVDKSVNDVLSILAMLSRRITSAAPYMDLLNHNECSTRLKNCCIKFVKKSMEKHSSILARWHNDYEYRKSLSKIG